MPRSIQTMTHCGKIRRLRSETINLLVAFSGAICVKYRKPHLHQSTVQCRKWECLDPVADLADRKPSRTAVSRLIK